MILNVPIYHIKNGFAEPELKAIAPAYEGLFTYTTDDPTEIAVYFKEYDKAQNYAELIADMAKLLGIPCQVTIQSRYADEIDELRYYLKVSMPYRLKADIIEKNVTMTHTDYNDTWTVSLATMSDLWKKD